MRISTGMLAGVCLMLLSGCGLSTDPTQGGLFGYNPKAYEARQQAKRAELQSLEAEKEQHRQETVRLSQEREKKSVIFQ